MNIDVWLSVGGPVMLIGSAIAWFYTQLRTNRAERRAEPRAAVETDSVIVAATKEVVTMIRSELEVLTKAKKETDTENERLEKLVERLERIIDRLRHTIAQLRAGESPTPHADERFPEDTP